METKCCSKCNETKELEKFINKKNFCKDCKNLRVRQMRLEKKILKIQEIEKDIGNGNKKCYVCDNIFNKSYFKHNKCLDCKRKQNNEYNQLEFVKERKRIKRQTDFNYKFKHLQSSRIRNALIYKSKKTIEYLGCNAEQYFKWLNYSFADGLNLENHGVKWHIDHVIPLSTFNLENEAEQLLAFNWRNTMPLSCSENLSKNNKIINLQIEQHYKKLVEYHIENKLDLPQEYIDLFAKHLVDGDLLKSSLPLTFRNICEEHD